MQASLSTMAEANGNEAHVLLNTDRMDRAHESRDGADSQGQGPSAKNGPSTRVTNISEVEEGVEEAGPSTLVDVPDGFEA